MALLILEACSGGTAALQPTATPPTGLSRLSGLKSGPQVGQIAPDFTLTDDAGQTVSLSALRGTPVLLNFWATWCGPCLSEMPELQALQESLPDRLHVVAVDAAESKGQVAAFKKKLGLTFATPIDARSQVSGTYNIFGLPASYIIDADGVVRAVKLGPFMDQADLRKSIATVGL